MAPCAVHLLTYLAACSTSYLQHAAYGLHVASLKAYCFSVAVCLLPEPTFVSESADCAINEMHMHTV